MNRMTASAFADEMEKLSYMWQGARHPDVEELSSTSVPYKKRRKTFTQYAKKKSKEKPSSWPAALLPLGGVGAGLGAFVGAPAGPGGAGVGALIGGAAGAGLGALSRHLDKEEIRLMKKVVKDKGTLDRELQKRIVNVIRAEKAGKELQAERRHRELLGALRERT